MAGVQVLLATEFIKPAIETYEKNHKGTIVIGEDIRKVDWESWRKELKLKREAVKASMEPGALAGSKAMVPDEAQLLVRRFNGARRVGRE